MRLIDADELREEWLYENGTFEPNDVLDSIDNQPTIDAVPVIEIEKAIERYKGIAKKHSEIGSFTMCSVFSSAAALMELIKENTDADS